jgi:very-short-patch-repair endonuclease
MTKFICKECNREFDSYKGIQSHRSKTHKISGAQTYVDVHYNGIWPTCQCGCNEKLNYFSTFGFGKFIKGHAAKINGGFYSEEGAKKSAETRKSQYKSGNRTQWNKGKIYEGEELEEKRRIAKDPIRREKISKALTGKPKTEEHRKIMLETLARNRKEILKGNPSKLEFTFADILIGLGVEFTHQYEVDGFDYDFYIPAKNLLIEVDGDYWHGHPDKFPELNAMQRKNKGLDRLKTKHAADRNFQLLRFWETDIVTNRFDIVKNLMKIVK